MYQRIKAIIDYKELSPQQFADEVGIARSGLTHIFSGRNQPSLELIRKILLAFSDISTEWLMMGVGNMLRVPEEGKRNISSTSEDLAMRQFDLFEENISDNIQKNIRKEIQEERSEKISLPELNIPIRKSTSKKISHSQQEKNHEKTIEKQTEARASKTIEKIILIYNDKSFEILYPKDESE